MEKIKVKGTLEDIQADKSLYPPYYLHGKQATISLSPQELAEQLTGKEWTEIATHLINRLPQPQQEQVCDCDIQPCKLHSPLPPDKGILEELEELKFTEPALEEYVDFLDKFTFGKLCKAVCYIQDTKDKLNELIKSVNALTLRVKERE